MKSQAVPSRGPAQIRLANLHTSLAFNDGFSPQDTANRAWALRVLELAPCKRRRQQKKPGLYMCKCNCEEPHVCYTRLKRNFGLGMRVFGVGGNLWSISGSGHSLHWSVSYYRELKCLAEALNCIVFEGGPSYLFDAGPLPELAARTFSGGGPRHLSLGIPPSPTGPLLWFARAQVSCDRMAQVGPIFVPSLPTTSQRPVMVAIQAKMSWHHSAATRCHNPFDFSRSAKPEITAWPRSWLPRANAWRCAIDRLRGTVERTLWQLGVCVPQPQRAHVRGRSAAKLNLMLAEPADIAIIQRACGRHEAWNHEAQLTRQAHWWAHPREHV